MADLPISGLPSVATPAGTDEFAVNQIGTTKKETLDQIADFVVDRFGGSHGQMFFNANATETVITVQGTPVKVAGTYVSGDLNGFTRASGTLTYTGDGPVQFNILVNMTASLNLSSANVTLILHHNGSPVAFSQPSPDLDGISPSFKDINVNNSITLNTNDTLDIFIQNNDSTDNITVQDISVLAFEGGQSAVTPGDVSSGIPGLVVTSATGIVGGTGGVTINKSFYQRIDKIVTITTEITFVVNNVNAEFNVTVPFTPAFTNSLQVSGTSALTLGAFVAVSDGSIVVDVRSIAATNDVTFDMFFGSSVFKYNLNTVFTYQVQ